MRNEPQADAEPTFEVERTVTQNDIRAYILVLPRIIRDMLPENSSTIEIQFGELPCKTFNLSADRRYVEGIAQTLEYTTHKIKCNFKKQKNQHNFLVLIIFFQLYITSVIISLIGLLIGEAELFL